MRISLNWISDFVDLSDLDPRELKETLTLRMGEVEGMERVGGELRGVLVGEVLDVSRHPSAEKLSVCRVGDGSREFEVICGAPNVAAGQRVAFASPGAELPGGRRIEELKIRGVSSQGMICSERELGLGEDADGILILEEDAPLGVALSSFLGGPDVVLEIDNKSLTHRPDLWGLYGIAREVAAIYRRPLRPLIEGCLLPGGRSDVPVVIEDGALCWRYIALSFEGVRPALSPMWMRRRLSAVGVRALGAIVDLTNYVMIEVGQPLHAFDLDRLEGPEIRVRRARRGETLRTLDGVRRELDPEMLVIADAEKAIALAGIMGGAETEVGAGTRRILLESANFDPVSVRLSSGRLGLRTEAVARFEKALDPQSALLGAVRFASLVTRVLPGVEVRGGATDVWGADPPEPRWLTLRLDRLSRRLGTRIPRNEVGDILRRLEFEVKDDGGDRLAVRVPSFRARRDVTIEEDLIEEVGRIHGYEKIEPESPLVRLESPPIDRLHELTRELRNLMALRLGFDEVSRYSFLSDETIELLEMGDLPFLRVQNPTAANLSRLRRDLLPGLLEIVEKNAREFGEFRLFEIGRCYLPERRDPEGLPFETLTLAGLLVDREGGVFYRVKGCVESLMDSLCVPWSWVALQESPGIWVHPSRSLALVSGRSSLGYVAELNPRVHKRLGLEHIRVGLFDLDVRRLDAVEKKERRFVELPRFPASRVDISLHFPKTVRAQEIGAAIRAEGGEHLERSTLFDVFEGGPIEEGRRSFSFQLVFRHPERTLTDEEVHAWRDHIVRHLEKLGGRLRGV